MPQWKTGVVCGWRVHTRASIKRFCRERTYSRVGVRRTFKGIYLIRSKRTAHARVFGVVRCTFKSTALFSCCSLAVDCSFNLCAPFEQQIQLIESCIFFISSVSTYHVRFSIHSSCHSIAHARARTHTADAQIFKFDLRTDDCSVFVFVSIHCSCAFSHSGHLFRRLCSVISKNFQKANS